MYQETRRFKAPVTYVLIALNVMMYLYTVFQSKSLTIDPIVLLVNGANFKPLVQNGQYYRLLTSAFLHADITHIAFNMYSLYILGQSVEALTGKLKYIVLYLLAAVGGGYLSFKMSAGFSVGASGAIFGLLGVLIGWALTRRDIFRRGALMNMVIIAALNLSWGLRPGSGIDNYAHIGGLITGFILSFILTPDRRDY